MIDISGLCVYGWEEAIRGMRNSWNSWRISDSGFNDVGLLDTLGREDHHLMYNLASAGSSHAKYRRMITVYCDISAPLYWWKEFDTYKVGTVSNSTSTMHTITKKPFDISDFSVEHLTEGNRAGFEEHVIRALNTARENYKETNDKTWWWQIIQTLPSSHNQKRTILMNYEVLSKIYSDRCDHQLDEWRKFCQWIRNDLPHSDLITLDRPINKEAE